MFDPEEVLEVDTVSVELKLRDGDEKTVTEEDGVIECDSESVELGVLDSEGV